MAHRELWQNTQDFIGRFNMTPSHFLRLESLPGHHISNNTGLTQRGHLIIWVFSSSPSPSTEVEEGTKMVTGKKEKYQ
jgi:hypothetical protein